MSESGPHNLPRWTVPAGRQWSLLFEARRVWVLVALCTVPLIVSEFDRVGDHMRHEVTPFLPPVFPLKSIAPVMLLVALIWPLLVWRDEAWGKREYLWSLPVARSGHDLWRVISGAAWLMIALATTAFVGLLFLHIHGGGEMHLSDGSHVHYHPGAVFWFSFFVGPLIAYSFASMIPLALSRPMEWLIGLAAGFTAWMGLADLFQQEWMRGWYLSVVDGRFGLASALVEGHKIDTLNFVSSTLARTEVAATIPGRISDWTVSVAIWLTLAVAGVLIAARRRR